MRSAVLRQTARGLDAVDLVVHVPDCESHEVTTALRSVSHRVGQCDIDITVREAAGAGSTRIIRAVEAYFRERCDRADTPA